MPDPVGEREKEASSAPGLRAARPPGATRLERRVAVAAILGAQQGEPPRVRLGRLEVRNKLGEGAMGIVYEAHDPELDRTVAVKVLRTESGERERARITSEARALARLSHPAVVSVYDIASSDDGDLYLTMEYVPGGTLRHWLSTHKGAPVGEVVKLFVQAARGLAAAHRAGVVHQDFKPENVLVGGDGRVRVADFGLAHVELARDEAGARSVRFVGGTPRYMAPELLLGQPASARSDQYSFCVALREALTGDADTQEHLPGRLSPIVARGLDRDPTARWPSMDALADALERSVMPSSDERHRRLIIDRVDDVWLVGVLKAALDGREPVPLRLSDAHEQVVPPWADFGADPFLEPRARSTDDLPELLALGQQSMLILGRPGAGKTTALLLLARSLLDAARDDSSEPVPVVLNLASFDPRRSSLPDWIVGELVTKYSLPSRWGQLWLEQDDLVLLLDGLDEVPRSRQRAVVEAIDAFRREHPVATVVACREDDYRALGAKLSFGAAVSVQPLDDEQVSTLLTRMGAGEAVRALRADHELLEQAKNPLMLNVLVASGGDLGSRRSDELWTELYDRYVAHALERRGPSRFGSERFRAGLTWLARAMQRHGTTDLWLERLQASWLERPGQRLAVRFAGAFGIASLVFGISAGAQLWVGLAAIPVLMLSVAAVVVVAVLVRSLHVRPVEALRWSWRRTIRWLPVTLVLGVVTGGIMGARRLVLGAAAASPGDLQSQILGNVAMGVLMATFGGVVLGLEPGDREVRVRPNQGITQSLRNALLIGVPSGVLAGVVLAYGAIPFVLQPVVHVQGPWLDRFPMAVRHAALFSLAMFFSYGGAAVVLHATVRVAIALTSPLPLVLVPFLDEAADRGLLRRVGGGYMFMHRTLQEYFAASDGQAPPNAAPYGEPRKDSE